LSFSRFWGAVKVAQLLVDIEKDEDEKPSSNPNPAERRNSLFAYLGHAIRLSHEKMSSKGNGDKAKQS
jgi:hypothetical protein